MAHSTKPGIENFTQWKKIWDQRPEIEMRISLLHYGLPAEIKRGQEKARGDWTKAFDGISAAVIFYLDVVDIKNKFPEEMRAKALNILADNFFGETKLRDEYGDYLVWKLLVEKKYVLEKVASFFKLNKDHDLVSVPWHLTGIREHRETVIKQFPLRLFELSVQEHSNHPRKNRGAESEPVSESASLLADMRCQLLEVLCATRNLGGVADIYRTHSLIPDSGVLEKLREVALCWDQVRDVHIDKEALPYPFNNSFGPISWSWFEHRPKTIQEAVLRGSRAATLFLELQAIRGELRLLNDRIARRIREYEFEQKRREVTKLTQTIKDAETKLSGIKT